MRCARPEPLGPTHGRRESGRIEPHLEGICLTCLAGALHRRVLAVLASLQIVT
jgi:hypothetical protein